MKTPIKLRTIVLEDEENNREWLLKKLANYPELEIVGWAEDVDAAYTLIATEKPDAAFMDIQLIGGDVLQLLSRLKENALPIPYIVMITGYPDYIFSALNDYRKYVVQYLLKPIVEGWQQKFRKSIDILIAAKLQDSISINPAEPTGARGLSPTSVFINNRGSLLRLDLDQICYLEVAGGGESIIVTETESHQVDITLNKFQEILAPEDFFRVSRDNIAKIAKIKRVVKEDRVVEIQIGQKMKVIGVGDKYYSELIKILPTIKDKPAQVMGQSYLLDRETASIIQNLEDEKNQLAIEGQKSERLIHNILPTEIAQELKDTGQASAQKFDMASVMFVDFKDFTLIAEQLSPEELVGEIDFFFKRFDEISLKNQIEKIKTIGDSYMAAAGIPKADFDNPIRIVQAALEIQKFLHETNLKRKEAGKLQFEARIGIHTGSVVAGVVGNQKMAYDVWGDTVNIAARLEQTGQVGKVCVSEATYEHVKRHFSCRYAGAIDAKNKGNLDIYYVEG
jgi:class 3 adenylate cyclase/DNA-binding LytR/AlgR family response regulator